jgi:hemoglobin
MKRVLVILASWIAASSSGAIAQLPPEPPAAVSEPGTDGAMPPVPLGEEPVDPYTVSNENAGATPFEDTQMLEAFHGREGIGRIVADLVRGIRHDKRIGDIFREADFARLDRTLGEQFCFILNGGCDYTGRDMKKTHEDHGVTTAEFGALVELLQDAMDAERVPSWAQNRFLAKLAPMKRDVVVR